MDAQQLRNAHNMCVRKQSLSAGQTQIAFLDRCETSNALVHLCEYWTHKHTHV